MDYLHQDFATELFHWLPFEEFFKFVTFMSKIMVISSLDEKKKRKEERKLFTTIFTAFFVLLDRILHHHTLGYAHGDIKPANIFINYAPFHLSTNKTSQIPIYHLTLIKNKDGVITDISYLTPDSPRTPTPDQPEQEPIYFIDPEHSCSVDYQCSRLHPTQYVLYHFKNRYEWEIYNRLLNQPKTARQSDLIGFLYCLYNSCGNNGFRNNSLYHILRNFVLKKIVTNSTPESVLLSEDHLSDDDDDEDIHKNRTWRSSTRQLLTLHSQQPSSNQVSEINSNSQNLHLDDSLNPNQTNNSSDNLFNDPDQGISEDSLPSGSIITKRPRSPALKEMHISQQEMRSHKYK